MTTVGGSSGALFATLLMGMSKKYNSDLNAPGALPVIIKLPDTETISLVEKSVAKKALRSSERAALGVDLSGVVMNSTTSGEPMQRLLVGYKSGKPVALRRL